jgi:hypothetical protein
VDNERRPLPKVREQISTKPMTQIHGQITRTILDAATPEERMDLARRISAFAIAALVYADGPSSRAEIIRALSGGAKP